jgi:tetratricopeptide (TPR) repeat protein
LLRLGRDGEAIEVLFTINSLDPGDEDSLLGLVLLLADRERYHEAIDLLDQANRLFPERHSTATTLARLLASSPDLALRDGRRALELAMVVYEANPTPVHGETVILSLAESGRCAEAVLWQRRILADAQREGEADLAARLDVARLDETPCRPASGKP